jgi:hypothetical protein
VAGFGHPPWISFLSEPTSTRFSQDHFDIDLFARAEVLVIDHISIHLYQKFGIKNLGSKIYVRHSTVPLSPADFQTPGLRSCTEPDCTTYVLIPAPYLIVPCIESETIPLIEMASKKEEPKSSKQVVGPDYRPEKQKPTATVSTEVPFENVHTLPQTPQLIALLTWVSAPSCSS